MSASRMSSSNFSFARVLFSTGIAFEPSTRQTETPIGIGVGYSQMVEA
jgi:hypothetical protein